MYMAHSPCFFPSPCWLPLPSLCSPFNPLLLTWNPPSCDRIRPPRSQVACKLTSLAPTLSPNPPPSKFPEPQLPRASLRRPQEQSGIFCPEQECCTIRLSFVTPSVLSSPLSITLWHIVAEFYWSEGCGDIQPQLFWSTSSHCQTKPKVIFGLNFKVIYDLRPCDDSPTLS
jgi:hypothetical protein